MKPYIDSHSKVIRVPCRRLVRVSSGTILEPNSTANAYMERITRFKRGTDEVEHVTEVIYPKHMLTQSGVPHRGKADAERVAVFERGGGVMGLADFDEAREQRASLQRTVIERLENELAMAQKQLAKIYGVEL